MAQTIIGHNNVYNLFSSITDTPVFESGLTLHQLKDYIKEELGNSGLASFDQRISKVSINGTSCAVSRNLEEDVSIYLEREDTTLEEFIEEYLTFKKENSSVKIKYLEALEYDNILDSIANEELFIDFSGEKSVGEHILRIMCYEKEDVHAIFVMSELSDFGNIYRCISVDEKYSEDGESHA